MTVKASSGYRLRVARFLYGTRGLWLLASVVLVLVLKGVTGSGLPLWAWGLLLTVVAVAAAFRVWAAGFIGVPVRGRHLVAEALVTAGPYAHLRNPLYLGTLVGTLALTGMSGLWYGPLIALATWAAVYAHVIPYEEHYLRSRFGEAFDSYRKAVPPLLPALRPYKERHGTFNLSSGLSNERFSLATLPVLAILFLVVG